MFFDFYVWGFFSIYSIFKISCNTIKDNIILVEILYHLEAICQKKNQITTVFWGLVVLQQGLPRGEASKRLKSQVSEFIPQFSNNTFTGTVYLHGNNAMKDHFIPTGLPRPWKASQTLPNHISAGWELLLTLPWSLLDFKLKGFWMWWLRTVFTSNSCTSSTRNIKWGAWLLCHSERSSKVTVQDQEPANVLPSAQSSMFS